MLKNRKRKVKEPEIVFDDDCSDSSDNEEALEAFRSSLGTKSSALEEDSSGGEDDSAVTGDESSEDNDEPSGSKKPENTKVTAKLESLKAKLSSIEADPESSSGEEEEEEVEEAMSEDSDQDEVQESSEEEEDKADSDSEAPPKVQLKPDVKEDERKSIREELKQMSFEEIQALKEKLGLKMYNQALDLDSKGCPKRSHQLKKRLNKDPEEMEMKRANKNRPREMSSKKQVTRFRDVVGVSSETNSKQKRDPRFDSFCGSFDPKLFKESYKFVRDIRAKERVELQKELQTETDPERTEQIKYLIQRFDNQERERKKLEARHAMKEEQHQKNKALAKDGKKPLFMSKSKVKRQELVNQYEDLKKQGRLDKYLKKKNKQSASKARQKYDL